MNWKKLLASASESVNDQLRLRQDYLIAENRILRNQIDGRVKLTDNERKELAEIGAKLGKQALAEIATVAQADTILAWHRKFANQTVNTSAPPKSVGRPRVAPEIEEWVLRMARENRSWGYDRIQGSLKHLGYTISDQTVGNILKRHGVPPAPERQKTLTWSEFIRSHWDVFVATGFFNDAIWNWFGQILTFLLNLIYFSRGAVNAVGTILHQQIQGIHCFRRWTLDLLARMTSWSPWVRQFSHLAAIRCREGNQRPTVSEVTTHDDRVRIPQLRAKVVPIPSGNAGQIRDGPRQHRQHPDELLINTKCKAA